MITPSNHEEADTCTMLHAAHMKHQGIDSIILRVNDTDVFILVIYTQAHLGFNEFWLSFGVGRNHIPVHDIVPKIKQSRNLTLWQICGRSVAELLGIQHLHLMHFYKWTHPKKILKKYFLFLTDMMHCAYVTSISACGWVPGCRFSLHTPFSPQGKVLR